MASERPGEQRGDQREEHGEEQGEGEAEGRDAEAGRSDAEAARGRDVRAVARLAAVLAAVGRGSASEFTPAPREIAEVLWLARQLGDEGDFLTEAAAATDDEGGPLGSHPRAKDAGPDSAPDRAAPSPPPASDRVPLRLPRAPAHQGEPGGGGTPLLAPVPPMLPRPLSLQRALRPLKRTVPSARVRELDERATADRIARLGAHPDVWLPVLRPARDRWLRLALVHDTGPTMPVWHPLVRELHAVLAQSGVFRTVTLHPAGPDGRARHVPDPGDGRTVALIVSDCMGPQWRPGPAGERWYRALRHWAARMPLAVVQPLPEHLWATTALPAEPGVLSSPGAAAPLTSCAFTPYDRDAPPPHPAAVPLPVLEAGVPWLTHWAGLLAAPGGGRTPGAAAWLTPRPSAPAFADPAPGLASLPAKDLVLRFRATASPEAFRLAGHLALAQPSIPVMRLVQRAVERDPRPQHLAEVILSGMLAAVPGPPGSYAFRPGVRDLLLRTLPRTARGRARELLDRVGALIDERAGLTAGGFRAETSPADTAPADAPAFAMVSAETVRRLGAEGGAGEREDRDANSDAAGEGTGPGDMADPGPGDMADPGPGGTADPGTADPGTGGTADPGMGTGRRTLRFETDVDLGARPEARISLEYAVHQVLERGDLAPHQYDVRVRPDGYDVGVDADAYLLPVLAAVLRWLPGPFAEPAEPPRLRVTFGHGPRLPEPAHTDSPVLVLVPPDLYESFADSSAASGPHRFRPLYGDAVDGPPLAWYCPLPAPRDDDPDASPDLVRGPFVTPDLRQLGVPAHGRTAVVHTQAGGPLTLLDPARPHGIRPPRLTTYYEVDLTPQHAVHRLSLPSSSKGDFAATAELTWQVSDPVAFVRAEVTRVPERLLAHLTEAASRVTRHQALRRAVGAQRAVNAGLGRWPVPGLTVTCEVRLAPAWAPAPEPRRTPTPAAPSGEQRGERHEERSGEATPAGLLARAETVLLGFDGPLTRLFTATTAREAALKLLALATQPRDEQPPDAERGDALPRTSGPRDITLTHPLDVLRVFARHPLAPLLRNRLDGLEMEAVLHAPTTHNSVALVRALHASGRRVALVTDVCERAVRQYVEPYRLPLVGIHGRAPDLALLTPNPDVLLRALQALPAPGRPSSPGAPHSRSLVIGSTVAELTAAQRIGLRFLGLARNPTVEQELRGAGCEVTVRSLTPVLDAARAL
ncbi:HAD family hydrolase [Streptomyces sp. BK239]|uniref:HAD family hydrolase n=1 Tax=Streptomyces sp. BK239 TaxID=2512155 RepID=UPI0010CFB5B5|nr:HAD family hydrolase [Streptomyces sp. BK239]RZU25058.1 phosphoglycolate phosphatase-like HAD superfamily hydrolase [Streptomyces sp. BK239]